jgi:malate/lactate dehydrogenase
VLEDCDKLIVCDVKPGLAAAFAEELKHVAASLGLEVEIKSCEKSEDVDDVDIILISDQHLVVLMLYKITPFFVLQ